MPHRRLTSLPRPDPRGDLHAPRPSAPARPHEPRRRRRSCRDRPSRRPTTDRSWDRSGDSACASDERAPFAAMLCIVTFVLLACFFLYAAIQGKDTAHRPRARAVVLHGAGTAGSRGWRVPEPAFKLLPIMFLGLLLRYLAAYFRLENAADALYYHRYGKLIAPEFRALSFGGGRARRGTRHRHRSLHLGTDHACSPATASSLSSSCSPRSRSSAWCSSTRRSSRAAQRRSSPVRVA